MYVGTVPGGYNDSAAHQWHMKGFDRDMNAFRDARQAGLDPTDVTEVAVEAAERGYRHHDLFKLDKKFGNMKDEKDNERIMERVADGD